MLNRIDLMGRFTRDPELRYTQTQTPVATFCIAVERDMKNKETGEKETDFIECVAWRSAAEIVNKYFHKGSLAVVSGRLQINDWTDKNGNKRKNAVVEVENIYFGEKKATGAVDVNPIGNTEHNVYDPRNSSVGSATTQASFSDFDESEEGLPF